MASFNGGGDRKRCLQVLGLSPSASEDDIQQAYRRLALEHHPDKNNNDPEATRKFQEISQAYRLLTKDDSSDDDDYFPFRRHNFYDDDDDDDDDDMFCGHSFFSMFAQELLFREMLRQMYAHHHQRFRSSNRYQGNQRSGERHGSQQRQGNRPNTRNDTRAPSWGRWQEQGQQQQNASRTNHFRSTQSDSSRHSFSSQSRGYDREETARSRQTYNRDKNGQQSGNGQHTNGWQRDRERSERQSDKVKEGSSPCHTTESQPRSKRRNRRCRRGREPQKVVLTQPKKLSKKELLAQEKRRQREMEKIGRELTSMQVNGEEECQESDDTTNA